MIIALFLNGLLTRLCVCVCVCERERERGGRKRLKQLSSEKKSGTFQRQKNCYA